MHFPFSLYTRVHIHINCTQVSRRLTNPDTTDMTCGWGDTQKLSSWNLPAEHQHLFTGQLAVEARQANGKRLKSAHGIVVVQSEDVFSNSTKLHNNVVG